MQLTLVPIQQHRPHSRRLCLKVIHSTRVSLGSHAHSIRFSKVCMDEAGGGFVAVDLQGTVYVFDLHRNRCGPRPTEQSTMPGNNYYGHMMCFFHMRVQVARGVSGKLALHIRCILPTRHTPGHCSHCGQHLARHRLGYVNLSSTFKSQTIRIALQMDRSSYEHRHSFLCVETGQIMHTLKYKGQTITHISLHPTGQYALAPTCQYFCPREYISILP